MHLKKYEVDNISEAMARIKEDFGPDAVILSTRRIGPAGSSRIEIVAALDREEESLPDVSPDLSPKGCSEPAREYSDPEPPGPDRWGRLEARLDEMNDRIGGIADLLSNGVDEGEHSPSPLERFLLSRGIAAPSANRLVEAAEDIREGFQEDSKTGNYREVARRIIGRSIAGAWEKVPGEQRVQVFVGPAGDGKTTTLAKIAARIRYRGNKTLGIITLDDFRIGAVEQLKIYGRIMDVPVLSLSEGDSLQEALGKFDHLDRVLVDTPGKSRSDEAYIRRLRRSLRGDKPVGTNLVVSATAEAESMADMVRRFKPLDINRVIVTKLDDARRFGCLFNLIEMTGRPVGYVTMGQQVPQDIRVMNGERIARLVVDREIPRH